MQFEENTGKRQFQCFVCGVMQETLEKFKNHIIDTHEEGEDFVLCPLDRCGFPVRDVRTHFKAKHPGDKMPERGMLKATIWRDISAKGVKKQKPKFKQGWYESTKMKKSFHFRSGYERTVYECLDLWNEVNTYEVEPFEIPYIHKGKQHKYTPDIIISFIDGHREVWEVKPAKQTLFKKNKDKWYSANEACKARGWDFVVITEVGMGRLKQAVLTQSRSKIIWD